MSNLFESDLKDITRLVMIRHGKTPANKESRIGSLGEIPLAEEGREQVEKLSRRLETLNIDVLYTSPLLRTKQTSEIIAQHLRLDVLENDDLKEFDFGMIGNKTMGEVKNKFPKIHKEMVDWLENDFGRDFKRPLIPGAEEISHFEARINNFCKVILKKHPSKIVGAVTHMATIKGFMSVLFGPPVEQHMNFNPFNASVSIIDFYKGMPVLTAFNDIRHLNSEYSFGRVNLL